MNILPENKKKYRNIIDYARDNRASLIISPLNELDMACFALLSYFHYEEFFQKKQKPLIKDLLNNELMESLLWRPAYKKEDYDFLLALGMNPRFYDIRLKDYVCHNDESKQEQFSALTFIINEKTIILAFRGTDSSLNGWKEDFNMAYLSPIPSQKDAEKYVASLPLFTYRDVYLIGHSKGGNLALYSYLTASRWNKRRIRGVYSFDGPGIEGKNMHDYPGIFHQFVPEQSMIGMLFQEEKDCLIVKSEGTLLGQHRLYNWHVDGFAFEKSASLGKNIQGVDQAINAWISSCSPSERELLVETLYEMVSSTGSNNAQELILHLFSNAGKIYRQYKDLSPQKKIQFKRLIMQLAKELISAK